MDILNRLETSKFRSIFHLKEEEILYIQDKGWDTIQSHAYDFIYKRLKPYPTFKDGKQTPMRGHPVFIAQHATATCCRKCLYKWHQINPNRELRNEEVEYVVNVIMTWMKKEYNYRKKL